MNLKEKILYHQIHPLKLTTDISASIISLYFFWNHDLAVGLVVHIIVPIIGSFFLVQYLNIEPQKKSRLGKYILKHMGILTQTFRLIGDVVMVFGAWYQNGLIIILGLVIIVLAWTNGLYLSRD